MLTNYSGQDMSIVELGWTIGLHAAMAVWLGVLASAWKGRNAWAWIGIGLLTSIIGLAMLARLTRLPAAPRRVETEMHLQHMDGTSLTQ